MEKFSLGRDESVVLQKGRHKEAFYISVLKVFCKLGLDSWWSLKGLKSGG